MLSHLHVKDYTLVDELNLDFSTGLTVLTGETGAGKSILLDALGLALGERADADKIRAQAERAEVSASFDVHKLVDVNQWLQASDLEAEGECLLRRVVTREGRSRAYINGQLVTLSQLRALGELLLDIHSQHEHQSLLKVAQHRLLLDEYGKHSDLAAQVKQAFNVWQMCANEYERIKDQSEELNARYQLLRYQVEELDQLNINAGELEELEALQKKLESAQEIQLGCQQVSELCQEGEGSVREALVRASQILQHLPYKSARVMEVLGMLDNAAIQVEEATRELMREAEQEDLESLNLAEIEQRLSAVYDIARKHRTQPEQLCELHEQLGSEMSQLRSGDEQLEGLQVQMQETLAQYQELAAKLSRARQKAAAKLAKAINQQLKNLAMEHAKLEVLCRPQEQATAHGNESVEFLISTQPGQPGKALAKIASGGELSRVSLAIQVILATTSIIPTLVFDEVDSGIGGATGDVVGKLLRQLGESTQVLCVTHLAQVASKAHQHLRVLKTVNKKQVFSQIEPVTGQEKVAEIARMMGGAVDSKQSLAHAEEMLAEQG